ncbi:unnamed protein product, partial [Lymnaea stagnalis]
GIVTNILNISILQRHGMDDSMNVVLVALAVSDMAYSISETVYRIGLIATNVDFSLGYNILSVYYVIFLNLSSCAIVISTWLVSVISFERMIAVSFPFHSSRIITPHRIKCLVISLYIIFISMYGPLFCGWYLDWSFHPSYNLTLLRDIKFDWFKVNPGWVIFISNHVIPAIATPIPIVIILSCTSMTVLRLSGRVKAFEALSTSSAKRVKEMRSIKISLVICLCLAFSILLPNACLDACLALNDQLLSYTLIAFIRAFTQLAVQVNASMNFFIYVALSSKFSKIFLNVIRCT